MELPNIGSATTRSHCHGSGMALAKAKPSQSMLSINLSLVMGRDTQTTYHFCIVGA
jgi:hypothetical protein